MSKTHVISFLFVFFCSLVGLGCGERNVSDEGASSMEENNNNENRLYEGKTLLKWQAQLKSDDTEKRLEAVSALGEIKDKSSVPILLELMLDKDEVIRMFVAIALGKLKDKRATLALIKALEDADDKAREAAAVALGAIKAKRAVPALVNTLKDKSEIVRASALDSLAFIQDMSAVPHIIKKLGDENEIVRDSAVHALKKITKQDFGADANKWRAWWEKNKDRILKEEAEKEPLDKDNIEK